MKKVRKYHTLPVNVLIFNFEQNAPVLNQEDNHIPVNMPFKLNWTSIRRLYVFLNAIWMSREHWFLWDKDLHIINKWNREVFLGTSRISTRDLFCEISYLWNLWRNAAGKYQFNVNNKALEQHPFTSHENVRKPTGNKFRNLPTSFLNVALESSLFTLKICWSPRLLLMFHSILDVSMFAVDGAAKFLLLISICTRLRMTLGLV